MFDFFDFGVGGGGFKVVEGVLRVSVFEVLVLQFFLVGGFVSDVVNVVDSQFVFRVDVLNGNGGVSGVGDVVMNVLIFVSIFYLWLKLISNIYFGL